MKALYTNEKEIQDQIISEKELKTYNYDSRYEALKQGHSFVHLFETFINNLEKKEYKYYSTMKL